MSRRTKFTPAEDQDLLDFVDKNKSRYLPGGKKALAAGGGTANNHPQLAGHEVQMATTDSWTKDQDDYDNDKQDQDRTLSTTPHTMTTALRTDDDQQTD